MTAKRHTRHHQKVDVCTTIMLKGLLFAEKFQLADRTCSRLCATGFSAQFDRVDHLGASEMCASNKVGFIVKIASNFKVWNFSRVQVLINLSDGLVYLKINEMSWITRCSCTESVRGARVLITGASSGIGEQMAYHYAKFGAQIVITARRVDALKKVSSFVPNWFFNNVVLKQCFSIPVLGIPCSAHFACLPYLTHLIEIISSLVQFMALSPTKLMISISCVK